MTGRKEKREELTDRLGFLNGCLYLRDAGICIVSDLHIGLEDELRRQGLAFPLNEKTILTERLNGVLDEFRPKTFVINGDIFHSFDRIDSRIRDKFSSVLRLLEKGCEVVLLKGSHDTLISKIYPDALERYDADGFTFAHGHEALEGFGTLVMGHEHPVIEIEMQRLPCFLFGRKAVCEKDLLITPAFNPLCQGVTINQVEGRDFMSPMLKRINTGELEPVVEFQGEVLEFPRLRELRRHIS